MPIRAKASILGLSAVVSDTRICSSLGSYDKWIEVDLTNKRMYAYEKDNLVKTELVTAGAPSTPTVTGQYAIYAKFDQQDMRASSCHG